MIIIIRWRALQTAYTPRLLPFTYRYCARCHAELEAAAAVAPADIQFNCAMPIFPYWKLDFFEQQFLNFTSHELCSRPKVYIWLKRTETL